MSKMKEKLKPILDEKITKHLNLTVLQRIDPCVQEIIAGATHVAIYEFDIDTLEWVCSCVSMFLHHCVAAACLFPASARYVSALRRNTEPHFQFLVMNRKSTENLVESLWGNFEYEVHGPYVLYRNHCKEVNGIWFYDTKECEEISNLFGRILNEYYEEPTKLKVSSREIKVEKDDTLEHHLRLSLKLKKDDQSCVKVPQSPAPVTSPTVKFPVLENSEPEVSKACRTDLVKPSSFLSPRPSCSHVMPPITSFAPPPPTSPLISPGNLKRLMEHFYFHCSHHQHPHSHSPQLMLLHTCNSAEKRSGKHFNRLFRYVDNQFIEIVYRAVMNATEIDGVCIFLKGWGVYKSAVDMLRKMLGFWMHEGRVEY
ncbi:hypothetical protein SASPL_156026 [Salvia splendens]|uniref:mRNA-decapping enzyme 1B n=1 Tax=Salvia splendens TaxID=180675 RepID=A0A8X8VXH9_SALSN|nr:hypothetical protein SASPL_156026 [Salvia splendens]